MAPGENCERHEKEIDDLQSQVRGLENELARRESIVIGLQHDMKNLADRVPPDLGNWMGRTSVTLEGLSRGQNDVVSALREGYVTVPELREARAEHETFAKKSDVEALRLELAPIKTAFYKAAAIIGGTILLGLLGLLLELKRLPPHP